MNKKFEKLGFLPADILVPHNCDMEKWAVIACDQFTSEPAYWDAVEAKVGDAPSTLRLFLPEAKLKSPCLDQLVDNINHSMEEYLSNGIFETLSDTMIYVERKQQSNGKIRHGIVGMVDLECYDFHPGSGSLIRATEGTIPSRIPPRARVRRNAPIELPHVMVLVDNPEKTVIEPLTEETSSMKLLYDFDLMQDGGHIKGYQLTEEQMDRVADALEDLCQPDVQFRKYGLKDADPLLFAMGDGNHSLATAKACYEEQKKGKTPEEYLALPSRYALVEIVNLHDDALEFAAIQRVIFGVDPEDFIREFKKMYPDAYEGQGEGHTFAYIYQGKSGYLTVPHPEKQLCIATVQDFLDTYTDKHGCEVDYIHGEDVVDRLGSKPGNLGLKMPVLEKDQLFKTVMADGVTPRKTFSLGHANDKRYYIEARVIK